MRKLFFGLLMFLVPILSFGGADRIVDADYLRSPDGTKTWTPPAATDTLVGRASTDTLSNKSLSGSTNTLSDIPTSAIASSALSGTNTGDVTLGTANGLSLTLQALSLGIATDSLAGALSSTDWTTFNGKLTSPLTTKGDLLGFTTVHVRLGVGTNGQILTADSTEDAGVKWADAPATAPSITGSTGTPTAITAAGGVAFTGTAYKNIWFIAGDAAPIDITADPQIAAGTNVGQELTLIGQSDTNTVKFEHGTGLSLNGMFFAAKDSAITLTWDGTLWVEVSRR